MFLGGIGLTSLASEPVRGRRDIASFLAMLVGLVTCVPGVAQQRPPSYIFTTYGMDEGLSQGTVEALLQDSTGFLWVGTHSGVDRFDGRDFESFRSRRDDPGSLPDGFVLSMEEAGTGRLWVGMAAGGLALLDPADGATRGVDLGELRPPTTIGFGPGSTPEIRRAVEGAHGVLILLTDRGPAWLDPRSGAHAYFEATEPAEAMDACRLPGGDVALALRNGSVEVVTVTVVGETPTIRVSPWLELDNPPRRLRCPERGIPLLVATQDRRVWRLQDDTAALELIGRYPQSDGARGRLASDLVGLSDGSVWVGTNDGLWRFWPEADSAVRVEGERPDRALPHPDIRQLLVDRTGTLWVGTWNGLASLHPLHAAIRRIPVGPSGLRGAGVVAIEGDPAGGLWIGNEGGGIQRLVGDWRGGHGMVQDVPALDPWSDALVYDLEVDRRGRLWVAAYTHGVVRLEEDGTAGPVEVRGLDGETVDAVVYSVMQDHAGDIWAGSYANGLLLLDETEDAFLPYRVTREGPPVGGNWVWPIAEDADGRLWTGWFEAGLVALSPDRTSIEVLEAGPGGLSDDRIISLFVDSAGRVWVGTEGGGLNRVTPDTGEVMVFTVEEGLPHDNVQSIVEDRQGNMWVSTADGLARLDRELEDVLVFTDAAGLAGNRFWANAVHRAEDGVLVFGGQQGMTILDPAEMRRRSTPPPAALTGFRIQGREESLSRALTPGGLDLAPDENFFSFEFAALDFVDPSQNRYRYRLEGLDPEWIDAGTTNVANYTSVPPDRYVFRVAARNSEGVWNEDALALPIRVRAPYYQTAWFRTSALLLLATMVYGLYAYRVRQLQARQALRLEIAGGLHDDIGADLSTIALKASMVGRNDALDGRSREQLAKVAELARASAHKVRETVWVVNTRYDTLSALVSKMRDTVDVILEGQADYTFEMPDEIPERVVQMEVRRNVHLMFKEALHNVVKHARGSRVRIRVDLREGDIRFEVSDDGPGFDAQTSDAGSGLGLLDHRARSCGGRAEVWSQPGEGTTVRVRARL